MSRPPGLTRELAAAICSAVATAGVSPAAAARMMGVAPSTFFGWTHRGKFPGPGDHLYVELVENIERSRGFFIVKMSNTIAKAAEHDWRAGVKLLELNDRRWGEAGGVKTGAGDGTLTVRVEVEEKVPRGADAVGPERERDPVHADVVDGGLGESGGGGRPDGVIVDVPGRAVA